MADWQDDAVVASQYEDAANLASRAVLYVRYSTAEQSLHEWLFDQFDLPEDAAVLSLGAGPGTLWADNLDRIPDGWDVTVTDTSSGMVMDAMETLEDADREFNFDVVDARDVPYPNDTFDAVTANHMLYHVDDADREQVFQEVDRVLADDGALYASTNGSKHLRELYEVGGEYGTVPDDLDFSLDNGADQLAEHFESVERRDFEDSLQVTEPEPLVAYLLSLPGFDAEHAVEMEREFNDRIGEDALELTTNSGLFVAR